MTLFWLIYLLGFIITYYGQRWDYKTHINNKDAKYKWEDFLMFLAFSLLSWLGALLFSIYLIFVRWDIINKFKKRKFLKYPSDWL